MTDEVNAAAADKGKTPDPAAKPAAADEAPTATAVEDANLAKAVEHGYVEPEPPSHQARSTELLASFEHAMANNAPMTPAMLTELRALLLGD